LETIYDFFAKPKDPKFHWPLRSRSENGLQVKLKSLKQLITEHSSRKERACFVQRYLVQPRTMNAIAVNTRG